MIPLLLACALTICVETPFLALFGFRDRVSLGVILCANAVTNLTMNLILGLLRPLSPPVIAAAEILVIAAEYGVYRLAFGRDQRLLPLTIAANLLSFSLGLLIRLI